MTRNIKNKKVLDTIIKLLNLKNKKNYNINYMEEELIDSLEMVKFISLLEKKLKIKFTQKDFEKRDFVNVLGLKKIIDKKLK